ncbi:MAG: sterol desaturase family protein [Nitrospira sp.]|nr:sterol desaturase family protein [Nitrospira sp.]
MGIDTVRWFLERVAEYALSAVSAWEQFTATIGQIPRVFVNLSNGLAWPYLLSSLAFAWAVYVVAKRAGRLADGFFREFAFPARLYRHQSTLLDVRFAAIDIVLTFLFYVPIMTGLGMLGAKGMSWLLVGHLGWEPPRALSPTAIVMAAGGFAIALMGMHLRHLHIWLSYGRVFNRLFISPAHHQIHHSVDPRHWNKNFGSKLSIWDGLFGTHYQPRQPEVLRVGLLDAASREFETVWSLYTSPVARSVHTLVGLPERRI